MKGGGGDWVGEGGRPPPPPPMRIGSSQWVTGGGGGGCCRLTCHLPRGCPELRRFKMAGELATRQAGRVVDEVKARVIGAASVPFHPSLISLIAHSPPFFPPPPPPRPLNCFTHPPRPHLSARSDHPTSPPPPPTPTVLLTVRPLSLSPYRLAFPHCVCVCMQVLRFLLALADVGPRFSLLCGTCFVFIHNYVYMYSLSLSFPMFLHVCRNSVELH